MYLQREMYICGSHWHIYIERETLFFHTHIQHIYIYIYTYIHIYICIYSIYIYEYVYAYWLNVFMYFVKSAELVCVVYVHMYVCISYQQKQSSAVASNSCYFCLLFLGFALHLFLLCLVCWGFVQCAIVGAFVLYAFSWGFVQYAYVSNPNLFASPRPSADAPGPQDVRVGRRYSPQQCKC